MTIPSYHAGIQYSSFLSELSRVRDTKVYLEVGVLNGALMSQIFTDEAVGVDPEFQLTNNVALNKRQIHLLQMTSDAFFNSPEACSHLSSEPDLVFLDGLHVFEYLLRDFYNAERLCHKRSLIVLHDCLPLNAEMVHRDPTYAVESSAGTNFPGYWTGDVWKVIPILQHYRPDLTIKYVDCPPTGLVCITNLDPENVVLQTEYMKIVEHHSGSPNDRDAIESLYRSLTMTSAETILSTNRHSSYFRL